MFSEQDVDRELKAALSATPSAGFEARVLQRVEEDRQVRVTGFGVGRLVMPIAASVVIVAGLFYTMNRAPSVPARPTPPVVARTVPPLRPIPPTPGVAAVEPSNAKPTHAPRPPRPAEPETIVPVNQMEAVRRLVRAVNEGRIPAPTELEEAEEALAVRPTEVVVVPLAVDPIPVPALEPDAAAQSPIIRGHK